jgi:L-2-hydroxyglutarate oxidase LhgO
MDTNITIIGAGVIGLAIAAELSKNNEAVFVLEKKLKPGQETSSRNSEVIHSGIYYPKGSLKAKLCVEGKKILYDYCDLNHIDYSKCGKLIVSNSPNEGLVLQDILDRAKVNGAEDGRIIEKDEILELEPHIDAERALYFPTTGIIDTHGLIKQLEADASNQGVEMVYGSEVTQIQKIENGYQVTVSEQHGAGFSFSTKYLINCAGLYAENISKMAGILNPSYAVYFWKGEYFSLANGKHKLVSRLVYPVPNKNTEGLGIHTTIDLTGRVKLGPNAVFMESNELDYSLDKKHSREFYLSAKKYLPFLEEDDLVPDQVGIRPKLQKPGDAIRDFVISEESNLGFAGFTNLIGIESPGLTACLSIAKYVRDLVSIKK